MGMKRDEKMDVVKHDGKSSCVKAVVPVFP